MSSRSLALRNKMKGSRPKPWLAACALAAVLSVPPMAAATAQETKPNILVIMGDDVGWESLGSYHQGLMLDATPNLDRLASEGMRFTDYYAEASARRAEPTLSLASCPSAPG